jgi:hypothetical protein
MKYAASVNGTIYAEYYVLEKALDHARVALEDDRFLSVGITKVNDDGTPFDAQVSEPMIPSSAVEDM